MGDLDGDADLDVVIANLAHRFYDFSDKTQVLLNQGAGLSEDIKRLESADGAAVVFKKPTRSLLCRF